MAELMPIAPFSPNCQVASILIVIFFLTSFIVGCSPIVIVTVTATPFPTETLGPTVPPTQTPTIEWCNDSKVQLYLLAVNGYLYTVEESLDLLQEYIDRYKSGEIFEYGDILKLTASAPRPDGEYVQVEPPPCLEEVDGFIVGAQRTTRNAVLEFVDMTNGDASLEEVETSIEFAVISYESANGFLQQWKNINDKE